MPRHDRRPPRYLDLTPEEFREEYWAWRRLLDNAMNMRAARSTGRCLRRVELIEAIARKRRIRLGPPARPGQEASAMREPQTSTGRRGPGRPRGPHVAPWHGSRVLPGGPWRPGREWMRRGACTAPDVDPDWFTVEETTPGAATVIARAKAVCRACPVRLLCRIHADETGEYGVYAGETHTERTRRLRRWRRLELPA